jgi:hypothetical protein
MEPVIQNNPQPPPNPPPGGGDQDRIAADTEIYAFRAFTDAQVMHIVTGVTACVFLYLVFYLHHSDLKLHLRLTFYPLYSVSSSAIIMCNSELRFICRVFKYFKV